MTPYAVSLRVLGGARSSKTRGSLVPYPLPEPGWSRPPHKSLCAPYRLRVTRVREATQRLAFRGAGWRKRGGWGRCGDQKKKPKTCIFPDFCRGSMWGVGNRQQTQHRGCPSGFLQGARGWRRKYTTVWEGDRVICSVRRRAPYSRSGARGNAVGGVFRCCRSSACKNPLGYWSLVTEQRGGLRVCLTYGREYAGSRGGDAKAHGQICSRQAAGGVEHVPEWTCVGGGGGGVR
jgi:hypothetical protein